MQMTTLAQFVSARGVVRLFQMTGDGEKLSLLLFVQFFFLKGESLLSEIECSSSTGPF